MDFLRQIVGGPKNRYKENGYNLDLTYITSRIIAMAFPASGIEKLYRNNIDSVSQFLAKTHHDKYITINLSGREVDSSKLKNVFCFDWEDHQAPSFDVLFVICQRVGLFLSEDSERIAVFHCNHGKGRTGTIICCFFLYFNLFASCAAVMDFYAARRFQTQGYGVTQPCQIRYIKYFLQYLQNSGLHPQPFALKRITFHSTTLSKPYAKFINQSTQQLICNTKQVSKLELEKEHEVILKLNDVITLAGDVIINIKNEFVVGNNHVASYFFNTAFIETSKVLRIRMEDLSPLSMQKAGGEDFQMEIQFRSVCSCSVHEPAKEECQKCGLVLPLQRDKWSRIRKSLKSREMMLPQGRHICFGTGD